MMAASSSGSMLPPESTSPTRLPRKRSGRLARADLDARDVPGVLARITATVADAGANIEEVHHQRAFTMLAAQNVEIELVLQTRSKAHVDEVLGKLRSAGMEADLI
jgi:threonine dehydratase